MIGKLISNGRPGVSRGALDAAISLDIPHGGWTSIDGILGHALLPAHYTLQELATRTSSKCTQLNVRESDATLILLLTDDMPDDVIVARKCAEKHHRPYLVVHLHESGTFQASQTIHDWLKTFDIHVLNVVGSTADAIKNANTTTRGLLEAVYYLGLIENNMTSAPHPEHAPRTPDTDPPVSVDKFVFHLLSEMPLKDRVILANMKEKQLESLRPTLGRYIRMRLDAWQKHPLPLPILTELEHEVPTLDEADAAIIKRIWEQLRKTHRLRIVD